MKIQKILIVDDNEDNLCIQRYLLEGQNYQVSSAVNGAEALELARNKPPDLIISDILMPVMDGFAFCRECKKDARLKTIPFVFYTATYTDERDREFALSLGAQRFIVKPEEPEAFLATIKEVLQPASTRHLKEEVAAAIANQADDTIYLKHYNEALIRKLEAKMEQLEQANRKLEQDVIEHQQAEEALRESEARLRTLSDNLPSGLVYQIIYSPDRRERRFSYISAGVERLHGLTQQQVLDNADCMYGQVIEEDRKMLADREEAALATMSPFHVETRIRLPSGEIRWIYLTSSPRRLPNRQLVWDGIELDITENKQAAARHESLQAQLTQAQKMESVGRLAGGVAHDFNNVLQTILSNVEMALENMSANDPLYPELLEIRKSTERSAGLTQQLLAFARKQPVAPKILDLNSTVEGMLKMLRRLIGENIDLEWKPGSDLWRIHMDPSQLDQILANLCVNARDAIGGVGRIVIETVNASFDERYCETHAGSSAGDFVALSVSDNGCGMDKEVLKNLFEPFFTTKEVGRGTGLGLATLYGIVKQNDGFVTVDSQPGHGSTFRIYLPRSETKALPVQVISPHPVPVHRGGETILLVEDEPSILAITVMILQRLGYNVLAAQTPGKALRLAREHAGEIHLLMTDVVMPEMNGRELTKNLLALYPNLKRLFMSGYTADVIAHHGVLDEGVHFIQKPFSRQDLAVKLRETLDDHE